MTSDIPLRAFIARPRGMEIHPIENLLISMGVTPDDPTTRLSATAPIQETLLSAIRASDFAVVVYHAQDAMLTYELGACDALRKPVLLVALAGSPMPAELRRYMHVRAELSAPEDLRPMVQRFVDEIRKAIKPRRAPKDSPPAEKAGITENVRQARQLRGLRSPRDLESFVRTLLEESAGVVEAHSASGDRGADLALWSDAINSVLPHPILVEIKGGMLSESKVAKAESLLEDAVKRSGAVGGLLLYLDAANRRFDHVERAASNIWRVDLEDFAHELSRSSLAVVLRRLGGATLNA